MNLFFGSGGGATVAKKLGCDLFEQIPIGQPEEGGYLYKSGGAAKAYDSIAKRVITEMEI